MNERNHTPLTLAEEVEHIAQLVPVTRNATALKYQQSIEYELGQQCRESMNQALRMRSRRRPEGERAILYRRHF